MPTKQNQKNILYVYTYDRCYHLCATANDNKYKF